MQHICGVYVKFVGVRIWGSAVLVEMRILRSAALYLFVQIVVHELYMHIIVTLQDDYKYRGTDGYIWTGCLHCDFRYLQPTSYRRDYYPERNSEILTEHRSKCELCNGFVCLFANKLMAVCA